ncbi:cytochrome P450 [Nocardia mexicana]|uniref:Cytochrome P450 n=1 Tax=Nocardia mexicana TaxID=279262 RepID=A0A370HAT9_9NOCA|nr:cytochrome P450 [Nocardia mexicana]RDI54039.1 hypothetical protein DFR68_102161 [Nocardia mexicana]
MAANPQVIGTAAHSRWADHARLRGAVRRATLPGGQQVWVVAGYDEVAALLADPRLSLDKRHSGGGYAGFALPPALDRNLLNMDGAEHIRVRRLAAPAFSRRSAETLRTLVSRIAETAFAALPGGSDPVDILAHLCVPVPAVMIGELLGVPEAMHDRLRAAADAMVTLDTASPDSLRRLQAAIGWMVAAFTELVHAKRESPGDDLLSVWIRARDEDDRLTEDELVSLAFLMMLAGLENAVHLCGNIIAAALTSTPIHDWAAQRKVLTENANPAPFAIRRFATDELSIGATTVSRGETVLLSLFGADSDPARGARPSLMFGRGPHYCLGAQVGALIVDAVVPRLFTRYPKARLAVAETELRYRDSWRSHGLATLPVILNP